MKIDTDRDCDLWFGFIILGDLSQINQGFINNLYSLFGGSIWGGLGHKALEKYEGEWVNRRFLGKVWEKPWA